ncbi:glycosyltransferase [Zobellia galactanivorans]|uniref:Glycosyltransferase, family GT2 n=1 Tax=Zobellia galactanivorans (strain DSM 12802 / CCUG 47099 / CIP 106680 / NCIMB 13871 / Dsij) TaxID=63186 RepID=G0L833_ZOBGA|nr:glycosyltransferase [Zobellia galactanivorans]CAZ97907.1 Glycosyltransferase, family GT2 [Zobellia galactanivorans]
MSRFRDSVPTINRKEPSLSVIVPVYNAAPYLKRCVESICNQTYKQMEIILVDDGSTDESFNICKILEKNDSRIVVVQQANAGSSVARNTGLDFATGDYIAFIDSDDSINERMFETMINFILENELEVVECGLTSTNKKQNVSDSNTFIESREKAMERLIREKNWSVWRRIYKKELIGNLRFIPGKIHQDVFFTVDILNRAEKQGYIAEPFYIYNTENESITRSPYNMKKLAAKDAPYYVFECTQGYNLNVRTLASQYLIRTLLSHYDRLFSHSYLDPNYTYRKEIKSEIIDQLKLKYKNNSFFALLAKYSPFWLYGIILKLIALRIKIRLMLLKR